MTSSFSKQLHVVRPLILPAIERHKSQLSIRRKLNFQPQSATKPLQLSSRTHSKKKIHAKDKSDLSGYKQFFVNPMVQQFNLRYSESNNKPSKHKETDRQSKVSQFVQQTAEKNMSQQVDNALKLLQDISELPKKLQSIYNEQIKMQPPAMQNGIIALMQPTGNSYAPSVPLMHLLKENKSILNQLLIRSKAGLGMDDVQKEAHLSFYLASIYQSKQLYVTAIKFYKRFVNYAKRLQDKIGIALGANRLGICQYNRGKLQSSVTYHQQNVRISNVQNRFAGLYNVGISYRKLNKFNQAINSFQTALSWANDRDDVQSISLCHGQLATSYLQMQLFQKALQHYQKCLQHAKMIKKVQLQLDSLNAISQISFRLGLKSAQNQQNILKQTLRCSLESGNKKSYGLSLCNLGILRGKKRYQQYRAQVMKNLKQSSDDS